MSLLVLFQGGPQGSGPSGPLASEPVIATYVVSDTVTGTSETSETVTGTSVTTTTVVGTVSD